MKSTAFLIHIFILIFSTGLISQSDSILSYRWGISVQGYPAGVIPAVHKEIYYRNFSALYFRLGGNLADRQDFSPYNDNEKGGGFGGSAGYRRYFLKNKNLMIGANTDLWNMWIHWKNDIGAITQTQGTTFTLVLQPWVEAGYFFHFKNSPLYPGISFGFGREINVITKGKAVGQGWINSATLYLQFLKIK